MSPVQTNSKKVPVSPRALTWGRCLSLSPCDDCFVRCLHSRSKAAASSVISQGYTFNDDSNAIHVSGCKESQLLKRFVLWASCSYHIRVLLQESFQQPPHPPTKVLTIRIDYSFSVTEFQKTSLGDTTSPYLLFWYLLG